jgi:hypothetical protein
MTASRCRTAAHPTLGLSRRRFHQLAGAASAWLAAPAAFAHHGWSSFDLERPVWLSGKAQKVVWRNPHAELALELDAGMALPADLAQRRMPAQVASVDASKLLASAQVPRRQDKVWQVELAPLTRMAAWKVPEIVAGESLAVLGFTFQGERGDAILRAEYLFLKGQVYGLRLGPA